MIRTHCMYLETKSSKTKLETILFSYCYITQMTTAQDESHSSFLFLPVAVATFIAQLGSFAFYDTSKDCSRWDPHTPTHSKEPA